MFSAIHPGTFVPADTAARSLGRRRGAATCAEHFADLAAGAATILAEPDPCRSTSLHHEFFTGKRIRRVVRALLNSPADLQRVAARSYAHDNGFVKVELIAAGHKLRLHHRPAAASEGAENIHDHRWNFHSSVLGGRLTVEKFVTANAGERGAFEVFDYEYRAREHGGSEYGVSPRRIAHLRPVSVEGHAAGSAYFLAAEILHRIVTRKGDTYTTIVLTHPPLSTTTRLMPSRPYPVRNAVPSMPVVELVGVLRAVDAQL